MNPSKAMTLRLPADQAEELDVVAQVDGMPVSEAVRVAIAAHVEARRQDPEFRARLEASMQRYSKVLDRLAQ